MPEPLPRAEQRTRSREEPVPTPAFRRLRGYAFDPSLSTQFDTAIVNEVVFRVPWEKDPDEVSDSRWELAQEVEEADPAVGLRPGPVGEYVEVIDHDPASRCFYTPINLNSPLVLAQDGLAPTEGNPQFHQQMVYAVAMTTIRNFERALGRYAFWAPHIPRHADGSVLPAAAGPMASYVQRLRIYPHALREANAYYSPAKKALLFGYFVAAPSSTKAGHFPGGTVFTCLSHDVIAHETTHALLDGMHRRYIESTNPDSLAFHEAVADLVALLQHFSFPDVLRHQIANTRGDLTTDNQLGKLAQQLGQAIGMHGALRDAIGQYDEKAGEWRLATPEPEAYQRKTEPHARGGILVAAVFDAFLAIYRLRVADLYRIATSGTGVLAEGAIHPDLVARLAAEAAKSAQHVLTMCIRALDYMPPVDVTFGDYLRAIITADSDLVPGDDLRYRVAFIEAFRRRGIYPRDVRTLSVDSLRWPTVRGLAYTTKEESFAGTLRQYTEELRFAGIGRRSYYAKGLGLAEKLHIALSKKGGSLWGPYLEDATDGALRFGESERGGLPPGLQLGSDGGARFEIHSVRAAQRVGPDGDAQNAAVVSITQQRVDGVAKGLPFRGGATLIFDLDTARLRYAITKGIADESRLERQRAFVEAPADSSLRATYYGSIRNADEPFAMLHRPVEAP